MNTKTAPVPARDASASPRSDAAEAPQSAATLRAELDRLSARRDQLTADLSATTSGLTDARAAVVDGAEGSVDAALALQSRYDVLRGSLLDLDGRTGAIQQRLSAAEREAVRADRLRWAVDATHRAVTLREKADAAWATMGRALAEHSGAYIEAVSEWMDLAQKFERIREEHGIKPAEIEQAGGTPEPLTFRSAGRMYGNGEYPDIAPFSDVVLKAVERVSYLRREAARQKRSTSRR